MKPFEYIERRRSQIDRRILAGYDVATAEPAFFEDQDREVHMYVCGISGSGKTRFLESMLLQDIAKGHPVCLIDPTGYLYQKALQAVAYGIERAEERGFSRYDLQGRYLFLDVTDPSNPVGLNPLEPQGIETTEQQVDDLLKTIERLLGSLNDQRRIRDVLRNALWVMAELNRLPAKLRPKLPEGWEYPLNLDSAGEFVFVLENDVRLRLAESIPNSHLNNFAKNFWRLFAKRHASEQRELSDSSVNVLQYLLGDSLVRSFLGSTRSSIHIPDLLHSQKSLFCHLPLGENLIGMELLGKFIATKFQRSAYRRSLNERKNAYYLYIDEFHHFVDQDFADAAATLRQYGLRLVNAHQSQNQPPFHVPDGKAILSTIRANSRIKAIFQVDREDAETLSKELFALSQQRLNFYAPKYSKTYSEQRTWSLAFSFQQTEGTAETWSRAQSRSLAESKTMGLGKTHGTNIGQTLTKGFGGSRAVSLSKAISRSEARGITESYSEQHGISVAIGESWSQMRDFRRGFNLTFGENESFAVQQGFGQSTSETQQQGQTDTRGTSSQLTLSNGTTIERGSNDSIAYYDGGGSRSTQGENNSSGSMESVARSAGEEYSRAISMIQGISRSLEENFSRSETKGRKQDVGRNWSEGEGQSQGGSRQESTSNLRGRSWGENFQETVGETKTQALTESENWEESLAEAFSILEQVSESYSLALQEAVSQTDTIGGSRHRDISRGKSEMVATSTGLAVTRGEDPIYYTLEGERELSVNQLQTLPRQHFVLSISPLSARYIQAINIDDQHYAVRVEDLPRFILNEQHRLLTRDKENEVSHHKAMEIDTGNDLPVDWPFED